MKYYIFFLFLLIFSVFACFSFNEPIKITDVSKDQTFVCYLDSNSSWEWGITIIKNTLDDTAKIGMIKIIPGKTGRLFLTECTKVDSMILPYHAYKATKGELIIKCLCQ